MTSSDWFLESSTMSLSSTDMRLGQELAVSYDNIREHMKASSLG